MAGKLTTVLFCKTAPKGKNFDGEGLHLYVTEKGKYWRAKY
ncbi:DUF4102 domain-containing protein [Dichelobacter nodosus]|nr:DUF4102 domain-containing protein [Dichelobacter nodosus]